MIKLIDKGPSWNLIQIRPPMGNDYLISVGHRLRILNYEFSLRNNNYLYSPEDLMQDSVDILVRPIGAEANWYRARTNQLVTDFREAFEEIWINEEFEPMQSHDSIGDLSQFSENERSARRLLAQIFKELYPRIVVELNSLAQFAEVILSEHENFELQNLPEIRIKDLATLRNVESDHLSAFSALGGAGSVTQFKAHQAVTQLIAKLSKCELIFAQKWDCVIQLGGKGGHISLYENLPAAANQVSYQEAHFLGDWLQLLPFELAAGEAAMVLLGKLSSTLQQDNDNGQAAGSWKLWIIDSGIISETSFGENGDTVNL